MSSCIIISGSGSQSDKRHYQPAMVVHHSPVRTTYNQKRPRQSPAKSCDNDDDDVVLLPSTSDVVKRLKLHTATSVSKKEQTQRERAERKKQEALV